jgi:uncharacterized protein (UPF0261 family)
MKYVDRIIKTPVKIIMNADGYYEIVDADGKPEFSSIEDKAFAERIAQALNAMNRTTMTHVDDVP